MVDYTVPGPPGFFVHWIVYDIPPSSTGIDPSSLSSVSQGINGAGLVGYFGPCPPPIPPQPHVYTLEDGSRHKRADADQLGFKAQIDPFGLLNPGKMRSFVPVRS